MLANAVNKTGGKDLICGEFADQMMNKNFNLDRENALSNSYNQFRRFEYVENPYVKGSLIILKKSAVMLNSFGIIGHYPFAAESIAPYSMALAEENGTGKKFYISKREKVLPDEIVRNIAKEPGATSNQALISGREFKNFKSKLNSISVIADFCQKANSSETSLSDKVKKLFSISKYILKKLSIFGIPDGIKKTLSVVQSKTMNNDLQKLYILIFYELFISKKYDDCFGNAYSPLKTTQILDIYTKSK